jgi:hypothetical protein
VNSKCVFVRKLWKGGEGKRLSEEGVGVWEKGVGVWVEGQEDER